MLNLFWVSTIIPNSQTEDEFTVRATTKSGFRVMRSLWDRLSGLAVINMVYKSR